MAGTTHSQEGYNHRNHQFIGRIQSLGNHPFTGRIQSLGNHPFTGRIQSLGNHPFTGRIQSLGNHPFTGRIQSLGNHPFTGRIQSLGNHQFTGRIQSLGNHPFTRKRKAEASGLSLHHPVHRDETITGTTRFTGTRQSQEPPRLREGYNHRNHPFTRKRKAEAPSLSLHHPVHSDETITGTTRFTGKVQSQEPPLSQGRDNHRNRPVTGRIQSQEPLVH